MTETTSSSLHRAHRVGNLVTQSHNDLILTQRLKAIYWPAWVDAIARDRRIQRVKPLTEHGGPQMRDRFYDIKRVRFFMDELRAGRALDPISLDNECRQYRIGCPISWGMPFVDDGHHRFSAYVLCKRKRLPATLGGLKVHHEWLRGERPDFVDPDTM